MVRSICCAGQLYAHVGSRTDGDLWGEGMRGPNGFGPTNEPGIELLSFILPTKQLCVMHGLRRGTAINKYGSIQNPSCGAVSIK